MNGRQIKRDARAVRKTAAVVDAGLDRMIEARNDEAPAASWYWFGFHPNSKINRKLRSKGIGR